MSKTNYYVWLSYMRGFCLRIFRVIIENFPRLHFTRRTPKALKNDNKGNNAL